MKAKFGAIVVDGRGKVGGHVASKNRHGSYFRTKKTPTNPRTTAQTVVRNRLAGISQAWAGLSAAEIAAWNAAVPAFQKTNVFGDKTTPSGFNLYQRLNNNLSAVGASTLSTPPTPDVVVALSSLSVTCTSGTPAMSLVFGPSPIPSGMAAKIFATPGVSAGKSFVKSQFRQIGHLAAADTTPKNILSLYTAKFGAVPSIGQKLFVKVVMVNTATGQEGTPLTASVVVSA